MIVRIVSRKGYLNMTRYSFSISVVIGVYNDEKVLPLLQERLLPSIESLSQNWEIIFVDDGSSDGSNRLLLEMAEEIPGIQVIRLTRNFGQANALAAGMRAANGDIVVLMDSDLQDRPEDIPKLIDALLEENVHMAVSRWSSRQDSGIKKILSKLFQWTVNRVSTVKVVPGMGVFRAIRHEAIEEVNRIPEQTGTSLGLLHWIGFDHVFVDLERDPRAAGSSGYSIGRMLRLGLDRIFSYSFFPITFSIALGLTLSGLSFLTGIFFVLQKLFMDNILPGWTSLISVLLFLFGMNFLILGLYGQYIGRIYLESRGRPKYVIDYLHSTIHPPDEHSSKAKKEK